jgi:hypothetical protein
LAEYTREIGVAVTVAVVLAAFAAVLAISVIPANVTTTSSNISGLQLASSTKQGESSSSTTSGAYCLLSIPADAQLSLFANSTFYGDSVTYSNGSRAYFSDYSCPRPATGEMSNGVNIFAMAVAAESNASFIAVENGVEFLFQESSGLICNTETQQCMVELFFYNYGEPATQFLCGGSMLFRGEALAGIMVTFKTTGESNPNGVNSSGWNLQDPAIQTMSADQVMLYYTNSYPCG